MRYDLTPVPLGTIQEESNLVLLVDGYEIPARFVLGVGGQRCVAIPGKEELIQMPSDQLCVVLPSFAEDFEGE